MVQKYKRRTERQGWDENKMRQAIERVHDGLGYKTAARNFGVPLMSLKRRCKGVNKLAVNELKKLGSKSRVFTEDQESELVTYILDMESRMYGLTTKDVRSIAYQLAVKNDIVHPFSEQSKLAGKDWLTGFRKRHPELSLRSPESTSAARARAFNKPVVTKFFTLLKTVLDKTLFPAHRIFNVDETSLSTVPGINSKILAKRGRKQVGRVVSQERGVSTTAVICVSAGGSFVPPMLIFSRKRMKEELKDGAPPGTSFMCNDSGWMKLEVFAAWFDHFLGHIKPSANDPALLILDGHLSHTKNLEVIEKARSNNVTILCLPPHTTHRLQPLDLSVMYPLNHYLDQALEKWLTNHPGRVVTVFQISSIFNEAYIKACTPMNAINGFKKAGIVPYDPGVFADIDFAAAEVTEENDRADEMPQNDGIHYQNHNIATPSTPPDQVIQHEQTTAPTVSPPLDDIGQNDPVITPSTSGVSLSNAFKILPKDVHPLPKMSQRKRTTNKRKSAGTVILTSTPYKDQLVDERQKKVGREEKKVLKMKNKATIKEKQKRKNETTEKGKQTKKNETCLTKGKGKKSKDDEESEMEEDVECLICSEAFLKSPAGEGWVQCVDCQRWAHDECAGIEDDDCEPYSCDYCMENTEIKKKVRRKLC